MRLKLTILFVTLVFLSIQTGFGQSIYLDDNSLGISSEFGYTSSTSNISGTAFSFAYSPDRKFDLSVNYSRVSNPNLSNFSNNLGYTDFGASASFYPKRIWDGDQLTFEVIASTSHSTSPRANGFTFRLGTAISTREDLSDNVSFFPRAGFHFIPFTPGSPSQYSAVSLDGSFVFKGFQGVKILLRPGMNLNLKLKENNFAFMGGIIL